jgi:hypothetical protein
MLQKTTDEALRAEDDLAEAIDLIWMLDAAVRGLDFDPDTPNGRAAAGMASTFELVVEKLKGVGEQIPGTWGSSKNKRRWRAVPLPSGNKSRRFRVSPLEAAPT